MARQSRQGFIRRYEQVERELRTQRIRRKGHTESKTFIVGGDFDTTVVIPKFWVGIDHDGETPEWKRLTGFAGDLEAGTATVEWSLNGTSLGTQDLSTTAALLDLDTPLDLAHGDRIQVTVTASSGASGLSACAYIVTAAR